MNQGPTITQQGNTLINLSMEQGCILFLQIPLNTMTKLIVFEGVLHCLIAAMQNREKHLKSHSWPRGPWMRSPVTNQPSKYMQIIENLNGARNMK